MVQGACRRSVAFWSLIVVAGFSAPSAIAGGIGILSTGGVGLPASISSGRASAAGITIPALLILTTAGLLAIRGVAACALAGAEATVSCHIANPLRSESL